MRIDRRRALIMFGDITGSTTWARRSTPEDVKALMEPVYDEFLKLKADKNLFVKILGDGFMAIQYLKPENDHRVICEIFKKIMSVTDRVENLINASTYPRPKGFRVRAVIGPVWSMRFGEFNTEEDVIDYNVDVCNTLLGVAKEVRFIASESVRDAFVRHPDREIQFVPFFEKGQTPGKELDHCPIIERPFYFASNKIDEEDLKLWIVHLRQIKRRRKKHVNRNP